VSLTFDHHARVGLLLNFNVLRLRDGITRRALDPR